MRQGKDDPPVPPWLGAGTWAAMAAARDAARARGLALPAVETVVRDILLARHPALPACLISEAAAALLPRQAWRRLPRRTWPPAPRPLRP